MVVLSFRLTVGRDSVVKGAVAEDEVVYEVWMLLAPAIDAALLLFKIPVAIAGRGVKEARREGAVRATVLSAVPIVCLSMVVVCVGW